MSFPSFFHHATLFVYPDRKTLVSLLWNQLHSASPSHILHDHTVLDIDTARTIISWANSPSGEKTAILSFHTITLPAQNALLKILEEPLPNVKFILITSNKEAIIPTLYSRLQEQKFDEEAVTSHSGKSANEFLEESPSKRMKLTYITNLLTKEDEEGRKDREAVTSFIISIATTLSKNPAHAHYSTETLTVASYASDSSSSGKSLLEYLSLLLPQIKH